MNTWHGYLGKGSDKFERCLLGRYVNVTTSFPPAWYLDDSMQKSGTHPHSGRRITPKVLFQVSGLPHEFLRTKIPAVSPPETEAAGMRYSPVFMRSTYSDNACKDNRLDESPCQFPQGLLSPLLNINHERQSHFFRKAAKDHS